MKKTILLFFMSFCCCWTLNAQWNQLGEQIEGNFPENLFGYSLATSDDGATIAVGGPRTGGTQTVYEGLSSVQIFRFQSGTWTQLGQIIEGGIKYLVNYTPPSNGRGVALSADGNIVVLAERSYQYIDPDDESNILINDRVRVFRLVNDEWQQIGTDLYGSAQSVAISDDGNTIVISAKYDSTNAEQSGIVKVFKNQNDQWVQLGSTLYGTGSLENFGTGIDISGEGTVLAVGSPGGAAGGLTPNPGFVNLYDLEENEWVLNSTIVGLPSNDGWGRGSFSGASVSLSKDGNLVAISSSQYRRSGTNVHVGNVRVFENVSGIWEQVGETIEGTKSSYENTKDIVKISGNGNVIAFGTRVSSLLGEVKAFQLVDGQWEQLGDTFNSATTGESNFGSAISLSGDGSIVGFGIESAVIDGENSVGAVRIFQDCNLSTIEVSVTESSSFCSGENTTLTAEITSTFYSESTINWYSTEDSTEPIFTGTDYETPALTETTSYWVEAVTSTGCVSERIEVVVEVSPTPTLAVENLAIDVCENSPATLIAQVENGNLAVWYDDPEATQWIGTGTTFTTPELTENTSYWVQAYNPVTHCVSEKIEVVVTINPLPILEVETTYEICSGNEASLYASSPSNVIFWYANEDDTEYLYHGNLFVTEELTEDTTFWVEAYNLSTGCTSERIEVTITVSEAISAPTAQPTQEFQEGLTLADLEVEHTGTLTWYADAQLTQELPETTVVVVGTTYYVTQSSGACESSATAILVDNFLGNSNLNSDKFAYYPNPVKDVLNFSGKELVKSVQIYDLSGKLILNQTSNSISSINLSVLPKGTYIVKATTDKGINTFKIVKN